MKQLILFFLLLVLTATIHSQTNKVSSLINKINNEQFTILHDKRAAFTTHSKAALKLIKIGIPASKNLMEALSDSTKVIMAHLILCHIYFNVATFAGPKQSIVNGKDVSNYFLGQKDGDGLVISEVKENGSYKKYVSTKALEQIINYWKNKIANK